MAGFDVKAFLDGIITFASQNYILVFAGLAFLVLFSNRGVFARIRYGIERALTDNWQLTLLASTGIALSLASGYTTYDGLRNFTNAPLLSVAISFGIQGVMLIVAWLIGESFATGMNQRTPGGKRVRMVDATVGMLLGIAFVGIAFYWVLNQSSAVSMTKQAGLQADWVKVVDVSVYFLLVMVLVGMIAFGFRRGGDISTPYVQSMRLIVKNSVLWVMFLASMASSVFFSFDSHFNAIFPAEQRKRAAEIRTTSQIGNVVSDVGAVTHKRQIEEAEALFNTDGWKAYDKQLASLAQASQGAQGEIEQFFVQQMEDRRRAINQQQERITTAQSGQAGLANKKISLVEELSRLKSERPGLAAEYAEHKAEVDTKAKEIDAKRVDALAEDRGVEGTLKQGKGPIYRQRMSELATLQDQHKIKAERAKDAHRRLIAAEARISQIERELSTVDGDLAKLKGEAETAEQRIKSTLAANTEEEGKQLDPARVLPAFERARAAFRQQPDTERLAGLQQQCTNLLNAMSSTQATKEKVRAIDCDPKQAAEAAARVFALNAGLVAFHNNCAGGDKLTRLETTDALLGFGRKCLQDSGLISKDAQEVGARLSAIDMNRDDKAHRFVVTWNAFLDGNRLAYLSLILAIGVDSLVFMSGLFGANALRSPLSDVPSPKARSAQQLEAIIEAALLPDTFTKARLAREAMHPMEPVDGFTNVVRLNELDPETAANVRDVLNAGATIGAVREGRRSGQYLVRAELYEFLCEVIKKELKNRPDETRRGLQMDELEKRMTEALLPHVGETADAVLQHLHPIDEKNGFTSEIFMSEVPPEHVRPVRNVLTAGSSSRVVQRDRTDRDRYYLHGELYKTLARIRARSLMTAAHAPQDRITYGGPLDRRQPAIADQRSERLLANGHAQNAAVHVGEEELRAEFRQLLLKALELSPDAWNRISAPEIAAQALAAAGSLRRQARAHRGLNEALKLIESDRHGNLDREQKVIASGIDGRARDLLDETATEIGQLIPALILLPECRLLGHLIAALEEGHGDDRLREDEQLLLHRLQGLERDLKSMDWSDERAWRNVGRQIDHLNDAGVSTVAAAAVSSKPN
ncbi:MAG TPA: hypothetical protein VFR73_03110 [Hyphomicrobiaceae bacterium]|nr:hypothetical protein [Hyphomicrobiaceae bacterium]